MPARCSWTATRAKDGSPARRRRRAGGPAPAPLSPPASTPSWPRASTRWRRGTARRPRCGPAAAPLHALVQRCMLHYLPWRPANNTVGHVRRACLSSPSRRTALQGPSPLAIAVATRSAPPQPEPTLSPAAGPSAGSRPVGTPPRPSYPPSGALPMSPTAGGASTSRLSHDGRDGRPSYGYAASVMSEVGSELSQVSRGGDTHGHEGRRSAWRAELSCNGSLAMCLLRLSPQLQW